MHPLVIIKKEKKRKLDKINENERQYCFPIKSV
jgi:hypothetical protein